MAKNSVIVKRKGHSEAFDARKIYGSCYYACKTVGLTEVQCEKICEKVCREAKQWVSKKKQVSSQEIFENVVKLIKKHDKEAAFMYETHRDIS